VSIFGNIMSKIWGHTGSAAPSYTSTGSAQAPAPGSAGSTASAQSAGRPVLVAADRRLLPHLLQPVAQKPRSTLRPSSTASLQITNKNWIGDIPSLT
jgi:hypothetical protein